LNVCKMRSGKLAILIIDNSFGWTGAINSILNSVKNIEADFTYAIPRGSQLVHNLQKNNVRFIEISFLEIRKHWSIIFYFPALLYNALIIARFCKRNGIQIIHVNDLYNMTGILVKLFNSSVKLIHHIRLLPGSYISFFYKLWIKMVSRYADEIITVSEISQDHVSKYTDRNVTVLYDSVIAPEIPERSRNDSQVRFIYPANYISGKGQELALQAFAEVVKENKNTFLTFVGGNLGQSKSMAYKVMLGGEIQRLGLENYTRLGEFESDIFEILSHHDVVLNFSESESFSMVCLEALLAGKVLIATDSGGPKELFENGKSGFLIERNIEAMKNAMLLVANDASLRKKIGAEGKQYASTKFDPVAISKQLQQIYLAQVTNTDS
jgi:glycosyltransferase involved in cell wall biosynthesis